MNTTNMDEFMQEENRWQRKARSITRYMESMGLGYEMSSAGNVFGSIASGGSQFLVMSQTYHEDTPQGFQYFVGYYPTQQDAENVRDGILNASPRKRFVQCVIVAKGM